MLALKEITVWDVPNHIYITNDSRSKLHGYVVDGKLTEFVKPLQFDTRRRRFQTVENQWIQPDNSATTRTVTGSRGTVYTITIQDGQEHCSCSGFKFRGHCRHISS